MKRAARQRHRAAYLLLAPFLLGFGVFSVYPLVLSMWLSTRQTFGPRASESVGFANFRDLAIDPLFWKAVVNTMWFTAGSLFIQLPVALGLAMLLNSKFVRGRQFFRLVFFAPQLVGMAFAGILAAVVFEKNVGLLNQAFHSIVPSFPLDFPWREQYVMPALIIAALWMYAGLNMVYFLAALQNVDRELLDAARVDGAGPLRRFVAVTLPAIAPVAGFVTLLSVVGSFQLFELPLLMLDGPGTENRGLTIVMYLYQVGFEQGDLGYASAVGWALTLMLVLATLCYAAAMRVGSRGGEVRLPR